MSSMPFLSMIAKFTASLRSIPNSSPYWKAFAVSYHLQSSFFTWARFLRIS
jgi:hypothetical protein